MPWFINYRNFTVSIRINFIVFWFIPCIYNLHHPLYHKLYLLNHLRPFGSTISSTQGNQELAKTLQTKSNKLIHIPCHQYWGTIRWNTRKQTRKRSIRTLQIRQALPHIFPVERCDRHHTDLITHQVLIGLWVPNSWFMTPFGVTRGFLWGRQLKQQSYPNVINLVLHFYFHFLLHISVRMNF